MDYFPLFIDLKNKDCLVVGGGEVAFRKVTALRRAGARVHVVARQFNDDWESLADDDQVLVYQQDYQPDCLSGKTLVIAASNDLETNAAIYKHATQINIPINVVDNPQLCSFVFPAIVERDPITIAICSNGNAPVLARLLRAKIETMIPFQYGQLADLAKRYRNKVKHAFPNTNQRRKFWESVFEGKVAQQVFAGETGQAEQTLKDQLSNNHIPDTAQGEVFMVGAGPGDPELLTFKALRLMQQADVVVYDRLVSSAVLSLTRRDAKKVYVGKKSRFHCVPQDEINELLIDYAKRGHRVLRLKGGDPFIFGRGGEEAEALVKQQIPFQMVPGITSASGASNYCGIPLTHRDYAHKVTFLTGHSKHGGVEHDWPALAKSHQTLVIYMGLSALENICQQLTSNGLAANTPVAVIYKATTPEQQLVIGDLTNIHHKVKQAELVTPVMTIVGEVVKLRAVLADSNQTTMEHMPHKNLSMARTST